jgi:hypothetical protein
MLPTAGPTAAPSSTPPSATSDEPDDEQKHDRADGGVDDQVDSSDTEMDIKSRQQPVTDERADNPDYQVPDEAEPHAPHDLTSQPSGNNTNQDYDEEAFIRQGHGDTLRFDPAA